ncbi:unnamed protein product, partial [Heterosigma akashiwo]
YRIPPAHQEKAEEMVDELLKQGVIEESSSEFNAPIVLVQKKTGDLRMCLDLRALNLITKKAKFPLPTTREMFDQLAGSWYFSSMDMLWAYWSIPLRDADRHKTAFTLRNKKYCWKVMCFGLTNAPATFSHLVNKVFRIQQRLCIMFPGRRVSSLRKGIQEWTLITDHKALQHLKMTKNPSGRRARWIMTLMEFSPYITQYRKGKLNGAADAISRLF